MSIFSGNNKTNTENMYKMIYNTYKDRIFYYISGRMKDRNDARDITQNVFVHLWQYRDLLGGSNTENIIFKTCNQEIADFLTAQNRNPTSTSYDDQTDDSIEALNLKMEKEHLLIALEANIDLLPPTRKQIFTMNKLEGIKQEKIANELNLSKKGVKKQIEKAMTFLRSNIKNS